MTDDTVERSTFEAMDLADESTTGPPAVLLYGHTREEAEALPGFLARVGLPDHAIACCTTTMGDWSIAQALGGDDGGTLLPVGKVPRVILLSGMTNPQIHRFLDGFGETGLPRPIFAVATPSNLAFTVVELLGDLMAEHQAVGGG